MTDHLDSKLLMLRSMSIDDPMQTRRRMMRRLMRASGADYCGFIRFAVRNDVAHYQVLEMVGSRRMGQKIETLQGSPVLRADFDPINPASHDVNQYRALAQARHSPQERQRLPVWKNYYEPFDVSDQLRALVYHRGNLVGWIALGMHAGARFEDEVRTGLNRRFGATRDLLSALHDIQFDDPEEGIYLLCDPAGTVRYSSNGAADLAAAFRDQIGEAVRRYDRGDASCATFCLERFVVRIVRVERDGQVLYLVLLEPPRFPGLPPEQALTARQHEVAQLFVTDATLEDIGDELGITRDGVKYHLSVIYDRLGVSNRVELRSSFKKFGQ